MVYIRNVKKIRIREYSRIKLATNNENGYSWIMDTGIFYTRMLTRRVGVS